MEYYNLLDLFDRMVDVSNKMHDEHDFDTIGFDKCLIVLRHALKQYVPINLHLENRNLQSELDKVKSKRQEFEDGKMAIVQKNKKVVLENEKLRAEINRLNKELLKPEIIKVKSGFNKVEIDFEGEVISFLIDTDAETFNSHFKDASDYVFSKRKKRVHLDTIKNWFFEWYRALGFNCVPALKIKS